MGKTKEIDNRNKVNVVEGSDKSNNDNRIHLALYVSEALAIKPNVYKDIDAIYKINAEEFNEYYRKCEDAKMCMNGSLIISEYYRKVLGIYSYCVDVQDKDLSESDTKKFEKISNKFINTIKKAYPLVDRNLSHIKTIKTTEIARVACTSHTATDSEIVDTIAIFLFLANVYDVEIVYDEPEVILSLVIKDRFDERGYSLELYKKDKELYRKALDKVRGLKNTYVVSCISDNNRGKIAGTNLDLVYAIEGLDIDLLLQTQRLTTRDITEICCTYYTDISDIADCKKPKLSTFDDYFTAALHIKALCKAYKELAEYYKDTNNDVINYKLSDALKENESLCKEIDRLKYQLSVKPTNDNAELIFENITQAKEIEKLKQELEEARAERTELLALREFAFAQQQEQDVEHTTTDAIDVNNLPEKGVLIVGGFEDWQSRMKKLFPKWKFISTYRLATLDTLVVNNIDYIIFNVTYLSHSMYYTLIDLVRKNSNISIGYVNSNNLERSLSDIVELMNR